MPQRLPSPSSPTLAMKTGDAVRPPKGGADFMARTRARRPARPAPLSLTPGPTKAPSGSVRTSSGERGERTVSRWAVMAM